MRMETASELHRYFGILRKRVAVIAVVAALAVGGVVIQMAAQPARYSADVSMLVTPQTGTVLQSSPDLSTGYRDTVVANIIYLMQSRTLLERAGERLGMAPWVLQNHVRVSGVRGTDVLTVTATDGDPERAALIANTVTQEFSDYYSQLNRSEATGSRKFIEDQLSRTKDRLAGAEDEMLGFKTRSGAVGLSDQVSRMVGRTLDLQAQYDQAVLDQKTAQAKLDAIQSRLRSQTGQLAQLSIQTNPTFVKLRDNLTTMEFDLATLRQTYTDQHPKVQALVGRIASIKKEMNDEAARVVGGQSLGMSPVREQLARDFVMGQVDAEAARSKSTGITQILAKMQASLSTLPASEVTMARLQRNVKVLEDSYMRLSALYEDALIRERKAGSSGQAAVIIVDPAAVPSQPESSKLPFMATFAALIGVVLGAAIALLTESLDDRVRSTNQAEGAYGVPVLAAIPTMDPRSHRRLNGAPAMSTVSLPVVIAALLGLGAAAVSLFLAHQGASADHGAFMGRLFDVFQVR
jgi:polysaccharide biosynthesis transport protein